MSFEEPASPVAVGSGAPLLWAQRRLEEADVESPRFEAQLLLALALGVSRTAIVAGAYPEPNAAQQLAFERLVLERARHVPLAYLRGSQEFYGLAFLVTPATLIPRPETELLVDFAREKLGIPPGAEDIDPAPRSPALLADVGAGSGCIAVAALANLPAVRGVAFDLSASALRVARHNALSHQVADRLRFVQGSLLEGATGGFDLVVSNPPYIPSGEIQGLQAEVRDFEPRLALDGGEDGLVLLRGLVRGARRVLKPGGWLASEVAQGQADRTLALFERSGLGNVTILYDLAGIGRVVCGQQP